MNSVKVKDLRMGKLNEKKFTEYIEKNKNIKLKRFRDKYAELDFRSGNTLMELKSRNNTYKRYFDTMCGYNKIEKARKKIKKGYKVEIYFLFTNGLYKWDFKENDFNVRKGGRSRS